MPPKFEEMDVADIVLFFAKKEPMHATFFILFVIFGLNQFLFTSKSDKTVEKITENSKEVEETPPEPE